MSFRQNETHWWYACNGECCSNQSPAIPLGEPPTDEVRNWKTKYEDVHLCPACQLEYQELLG